MELEVGKRYVVRNKTSLIKYVEVLTTRGRFLLGRSVVGLVVYKDGVNKDTTLYFWADGKSFDDCDSSTDLVAPYEEKLQETFYGVRRNGLLDATELYISEKAAQANANGGKVVALKIEEVGE